MKFPKLDLVCDDNDLRPAFSHVRVEKEYTFASDAHILVRHRTSEIFKEDFLATLPDEGLLIPSRAIALMRKTATKQISLTNDKTMIQLHQIDGSIISYMCPNDLKYPEANSLFPDKKDCKPLSEIGINSKLLHILSEGMGNGLDIVHLWFFEANKAILCDTNGNGDYYSAIGIIMPCLMKD